MRFTTGDLDTVQSSLLYERLSVAKLVQAYFPNNSTCGRCKFPWAIVRSHTTMYSATNGCFPLCEDCWVELRVPGNRMPYYKQLILNIWETPERWEEIRQAVEKE